MKDVELHPTIVCYEREAPDETIHMDIKVPRCFTKLGHCITGRHIGMPPEQVGSI